MTWKNILNVVPNEKIKFIIKMFSVISFCNTAWIDVCREKGLEDVFQHAHCAYFLFDALMGAFNFSILLLRIV